MKFCEDGTSMITALLQQEGETLALRALQMLRFRIFCFSNVVFVIQFIFS